MKEVCIVSAVRTPIGNFGGSLLSFSAVDLGVLAAKEAILRAGISPEMVDEAFIGNILSAGLGQNMARQIAVKSQIPFTSPALTINKLCGSGLRAVSMAAQMIMLGESEIVLAGGSESMSNAPYILPKARWGFRMGNDQIIDTMIQDGLTEIFNNYHMGVTAENIAKQWNISRQEQDEFAVKSQQKAEAAQKAGKFDDEIVPVSIPQKKGDSILFKNDEYIKFGTAIETLQKLRPAFDKNGTVTAGNSSGINDGAAMLIVMSVEKAHQLGLKPLVTIRSFANAALDPSIMGYGPVPASQKALQIAGMNIGDIDLVEANEAFASQSLAVARDLNLDPSKVNVNGGAIALGHPIGASGARILTTLIYEMIRRDVQTGLATLCIGGGMGISMIVERK